MAEKRTSKLKIVFSRPDAHSEFQPEAVKKEPQERCRLGAPKELTKTEFDELIRRILKIEASGLGVACEICGRPRGLGGGLICDKHRVDMSEEELDKWSREYARRG